jgi:hypothetical protein
MIIALVLFPGSQFIVHFLQFRVVVIRQRERGAVKAVLLIAGAHNKTELTRPQSAADGCVL